MSSAITNVTSYSEVTDATTSYGGQELSRDAFLNLLVVQLQHQDPLDPQKNEEFVAQLAQFSSLEQLTNVNSGLESLYVALASMNNASMTQLLGQEVVAYGDTFYYGGEGDATLHYESETDITSATLTVTDEDGTVVWTEELGELDAGDGEYTWDGSTTTGTTAEEGEYTFSIDATDASGDEVPVQTLVQGTIDGMSFEDGSPTPYVDGIKVELGDIIEVMTSSQEEEEESSS